MGCLRADGEAIDAGGVDDVRVLGCEEHDRKQRTIEVRPFQHTEKVCPSRPAGGSVIIITPMPALLKSRWIASASH